MIHGIRTAICPVCQKEFVPAPLNVFKINNTDYCGYTCHTIGKRRMKTRYSTRISKPVIVQTIDGKIIGEYPTAKDAARELFINATSVYRCLQGKQSKAGEYKFTYKEDEGE